MWRILAAAVAVAVVAGCDPSTKPEPKADDQGGSGAPITMETASPAVNIGDVEAAVFIEARPALDPPLPSVHIDNLETIDGTVRMTTVEVDPPAPALFPVAYRVKVKSDFMRDGAAAIRFNVIREVNGEETQLGSFSTVASGPMVLGQLVWPLDFSVNALEGLDTPPESMLLSVRGTILLLPADVDQNTLDPASVDAPAVHQSKALRANPVRINFHLPAATGNEASGATPAPAP